MTTPDLPASLPAPLVDGYGYQFTQAFSRTTMDSGTTRQRRRFMRTPAAITASWIFQTADLAIFENFVSNDINDGSDWFTLTLPSGAGKNTVLARFTEPHKVAEGGSPTVWSVTAKLETMAMSGAISG